jgi:hypothetical protein
VTDEKEQFTALTLDELRRLERTHQRMMRAVVQVEKRINALDTAIAGSKSTRKEPDFWPDQLDLAKGEVKVMDKDGKVVAELRITGPDLEQWLALADVEPIKSADGGSNQAKEDSPTPPQPEKNK